MTRIDLLTNPMTTAEDIIVGGTSGVPDRLAVGSNGDVLTVTAGAVGWAAPTGASGKYDPDASPATAAAISEEFDGGALSSGWAWGTAPTTEDYTTYPHYGYFAHNTGNFWLAKAWTPGAVDITVAGKFYVSRTHTNSTDASTIMLGVSSATGTDPADGVYSSLFPKQAAGSTWAMYNRNTGSFAVVGADEVLTGRQHNFDPLYLMLQRTNTGPVWRAYISFNGITWMQHETTGSKSLTIGAVSLRISDQAQIVAVDWIRAWSSLITKVGA